MVDGTGELDADRGCPVLVSACLLGIPCTHDAAARTSEEVVSLGDPRGAGWRLVAVCPETAGGLPTPRPAAERSSVDGQVRTETGTDLTSAYERGAAHAVALARATGASLAILKARSPSCGCEEIYDGTFTRTRVAGAGVTATALRSAGLRVVTEEDPALLRRRTRGGPEGDSGVGMRGQVQPPHGAAGNA